MSESAASPHDLGFRLPPEWVPQDRVWLSWPTGNPEHWGGDAVRKAAVEEAYSAFAAAITRFEPLAINAPASQHVGITSILNRAKADLTVTQLFDHPHDDVWCRDHGPLFLRQPDSGEVAVTDWAFNAWGGKFAPWEADNRIPALIAGSLGLPCFARDMILEGGAIEVNGHGQLLTTEAVLLNPNRNPALSRAQVEAELKDGLGVTQVLWLGRGIEGDDTDGHVDDLARFVADATVLACVEPDAAHPNHPPLADNWARLQRFRSPAGRPFELVEIHLPQAVEVPGWRLPVLPASYVNFLIVNDGVLVPTFRQKGNDARALGLIGELFPGRRVVGLDALPLVEEGGSLHCLSMQQPAAG